MAVDNAVRIRSFETGEEHAAVRYPANHAATPQISPDGRELGVMGYNHSYFYDLTALREPRRIAGTRSFESHGGLAYHPGGKTVAVLHGAATQVKVYDRGTLERVETWAWKLGPLSSVAFSPDGTLGAAGSRDGRIVVWDVDA